MRFIGLDLAWSSRNGTGAATIEGDERAGRLVASALLRDDDEIVEFVREQAGADAGSPAIVAVDAPLWVPNHDRCRPAETAIGEMFRSYHAGAHPANRRRLAIDEVVRGEALVARLAGLDFVHQPEVAALAPVRQVVEVYPHPAMVSIFGLRRILAYKARPNRTTAARRVELARYHALLASLATLVAAEPDLVSPTGPLLTGTEDLLATDLGPLRGKALKGHEDRLDGLMCAYVAHYLWRWGMARARVFGSLEHGYITSPVPRAHWPTTPDATSDSP